MNNYLPVVSFLVTSIILAFMSLVMARKGHIQLIDKPTSDIGIGLYVISMISASVSILTFAIGLSNLESGSANPEFVAVFREVISNIPSYLSNPDTVIKYAAATFLGFKTISLLRRKNGNKS